jgi:hypothetical protein
MKKTTKIQWFTKFTFGAGLITLSSMMLAGCATPVKTAGTPAVMAPVVTPATPAQTVVQVIPPPASTPTAPPVTNIVYMPALPAVTNYVQVAPAIPPVVTSYQPNQAVMQAVGYAQAAAPLVPAPYGEVLGGFASLAALVAGYVAKRKNDQLAAANAASDSHAAAAAAMASVIGNQPQLVAQAMTAAASNGSTASVATHIASANSPT